MTNYIPTNGHSTRKAAIIELYEAGVPQKEISASLGCSKNSVTQAICVYRQRTGRYIAPAYQVPASPRVEPDLKGDAFDFCLKSYEKSVRGARAALEAMGL